MDRRRPRHPPIRPLVLIVEGHEDTRALYALALSATGFDVVELAAGLRRLFGAKAHAHVER